ncbi:hypothetical protein H0H93_008974 [Arthromyces matolae]|nr:hypothetical protein H0H93_008974 [Arthromyces matolae]
MFLRPTKTLDKNAKRALDIIKSIPPVNRNGVDLTLEAREEAINKINAQHDSSRQSLKNKHPLHRLLSNMLLFNQVSEAQRIFDKAVGEFQWGPEITALENDPTLSPGVRGTVDNIRRSSSDNPSAGPSYPVQAARTVAPVFGQQAVSPEEMNHALVKMASRPVHTYPQGQVHGYYPQALNSSQMGPHGSNLQGVHGPPGQPGMGYQDQRQQGFQSLPPPPRGNAAKPHILYGNEQGSVQQFQGTSGGHRGHARIPSEFSAFGFHAIPTISESGHSDDSSSYHSALSYGSRPSGESQGGAGGYTTWGSYASGSNSGGPSQGY